MATPAASASPVTSETGQTELASGQSKSTEQLCREAAQKLMNECHTTTALSGDPDKQQTHALELEGHQQAVEGGRDETTKATQRGQPTPQKSPPAYEFPSADTQPPSYSEVANTPVEIPLHRGDGTSSFHIPPPPPPSPGDALHDKPRDIHPSAIGVHPCSHVSTVPPAIGSMYPYATPNPMFLGGHTAYMVIPAHGSHPVASQPAQPTTTINQNTANTVNQNVNNVNVVVENNIDIGVGNSYPSYIGFSLALCIICCLLNPTALVCTIPAVICSCVGCCTGNYDLARQMGRCALAWNITALVYGITAFFLLVAPVIITAGILASY